MTLTIYGVARSRAARVMWACLELGVPFEHVPVIQARRLADPNAADAPLNTRSPDYLAINPAGQIPAVDDDGLILTESLAIPYVLSRKHGGPLAPATLQEEGQMLNWILWAATQCEDHGVTIILHLLDYPADKRDLTAVARAIAALRPRLAQLDAALQAGGGHLVGGRFTVADLTVAEVLRYAQPAKELFEPVPAVAAWLMACQSRPAFKAMQALRAAEPE